MSRFGNQLKLRHDMKHIVKIAFLWLCAALILTACDRNRHTPEPEPQKEPISFSALSQTPAVKADDGTTPLSEYHEDFGVWGIARHSLYSPYILWETPMIKVEAVHEKDEDGKDLPTSNFVPTSGAYWVQGYTYSFIAIAPYPIGDSAFSDLVATPTPQNTTTPDSFSFTIDMGEKYAPTAEGASPDFDFDLMGASAKSNEVGVASSQSAQNLSFNHLLTKLCVKVRFSGAEGTVTGMRLYNVDTKAQYELSLNNNAFAETPTILTDEMNVELAGNDFEQVTEGTGDAAKDWQVATIHLLPQNISDFQLYLDFKIGEDENEVVTRNFKANISAATANPDYGVNEWYNWNLTISANGIAFDVEVGPWSSAGDPEEFPID